MSRQHLENRNEYENGDLISLQHAFGISRPLSDNTIFVTQAQDATGQTSNLLIFPVGKHGESTIRMFNSIL